MINQSRLLHTAPRNTVLIPASQLGSLAAWKQYAQRLPSDHLVIVVPAGRGKLLAAGEKVRQCLRQEHHQTAIIKVVNN